MRLSDKGVTSWTPGRVVKSHKSSGISSLGDPEHWLLVSYSLSRISGFVNEGTPAGTVIQCRNTALLRDMGEKCRHLWSSNTFLCSREGDSMVQPEDRQDTSVIIGFAVSNQQDHM